MLFHYHFWTPYLEETEKFYKDNGFRVSQRIGKYEGEFQTFNPPLSWNDFRDKNILFRIIETRKGAVNITFGYGKKIRFDHIGFFVSLEEHNKICENAITMKWLVKKGEKRTFITTPYGFRIELQINADVVDAATDIAEIEELTIVTKVRGLQNDLSTLFNTPVKNISSIAGEEVTIKQGIIKGILSTDVVDPNGVRIFNGV
ncbi:hypothetical protein [Fictibacillus barbaricus]|uniref:VOC domain-containing protein n=1 Tax=Fictibacillus barbaricus TaxID=182136 RepID=A0ABU1TZ00_9BACL|nr:hypothetical protein [Fictibacillus barbaricus]MDR7072439.1 hypothetical protein [Fictibacillus barbaricus]